MPPKKAQAAQPAKKNASSKKSGGDEDFDALLKQLATATAAKGKEDAKDHEKHMTAAERKEAHRLRAEKEAKSKEEAIAKSIEQRAQQKRLQDMIKEFIARGGGNGMGQSPFLDEPKTEVECTSCVAKAPSTLVAGAAAMQGWRRAMEDAHIMLPNFRRGAKGAEDWHLFAVMDGHGGTIAAAKTKLLLPPAISREMEKVNDVPTPAMFTCAFKAVDAALHKLGEEVVTCGCTCVAVLIGANTVFCGSVGDSRAVLARKTGAAGEDFVSLSFDHKPENESERKRIEAASGHVQSNRVNGNLAMSRALGDFTYKQTADKPEEEQQVICIPEVHSCARLPDDEFVVVACDGIFDVFTNEQLVSEIRRELSTVNATAGARYTTAQLEFVAANITRKALAPAGEQGPTRAEGTDNMSIIIIQL